jgi:uncharacterized protein (TIGR02145 family)
MRTTFLPVILCICAMTFSGCKEDDPIDDTVTGGQYATTGYINMPNAEGQLLASQYDSEQTMRAYYYGTTDGEGYPMRTTSVAGVRDGSDTTYRFVLDQQERITHAWYDVGGVPQPLLNRFTYTHEDMVNHIVSLHDWQSGADSVIYYASVNIAEGQFVPAVTFGKLEGTAIAWLPGGEIVANAFYVATGVVASVGVGVLGLSLSPVLAAMGTLTVMAAFFGSSANASDLIVLDETDPDVPPPTEELVPEACTGSEMGVTLGVDPGNLLVALPTNGGNGPFQFIWSTGQTHTDLTYHSITAPGPGDYAVLVVNPEGCLAIGYASVLADCNGSDLGVTVNGSGTSATASATGGQPPYAYAWSNGGTAATVGNVEGLVTVTVTDANGCTASGTYEPELEDDCAQVNFSVSVSVQGTTATAIINDNGSGGPYTFLWSNGATTAHITGINGEVSVTVTDAIGCNQTASGMAVTYANGGGMTDASGNSYATVVLGNGQEWMAENLRTGHYGNGQPVPIVTDIEIWHFETAPNGASAYYDNSASNGTTYGRLYNWYAVSDPRNLCPAGWHVSSDDDWQTMLLYLDSGHDIQDNVLGGELKATGTAHWNSPNTGATNGIGFSALPGGQRYGTDDQMGTHAHFWTSDTDAQHPSDAISYSLYHTGSGLGRLISDNRKYGKSIRCVRD